MENLKHTSDVLHAVPTCLYAIADHLGVCMRLSALGELTGSEEKTLKLDLDLDLKFPVKVISSVVQRYQAAVLYRTVGNLGVLAIAIGSRGDTLTVSVIDFARMGKPERIFEQYPDLVPEQCLDQLGEAAVATYVKGVNKKWRLRK